MPLHFVLSQRDKKLLQDNGYLFNKLRQYPTTKVITWRCIEYTTIKHCNCLATTTSDSKTGSILSRGEHGHLANASQVNAHKVVNKINKRAAKGNDTPNVIVGEATNSASTSTAAELPSTMALKKRIQRIRRDNNPQLLTPQTLQELVIPEEFQKSLKGDDFLLFDSNPRKNRFLVFSTMENLRKLSTCKIWLSGGTFSSVPRIFTQLYTIHGGMPKHNNEGETIFKSVPLVYILTPTKSEIVYRRILKSIINKADVDLEPEVLITDYEQAFITAAKRVFPDVNIHGCYFHFTQCIIKHVGEVNQKQRYNTDDEYAMHVKMLIALAFVPPQHVERAYHTLIACQYYQDNFEYFTDLLKYSEPTWIGVERRNGETKSTFPIPMWNCYYTVVNNEPRTNNSMEGWHNSFHQRVGRSHEQLGRFIHALKIEQSSTEILWEQFNAGRVIAPRKRRKYVDYDIRLQTLVQEWNDDCDIMEYLRGIAHNVNP